jgi:putative aldouronate transport system permease protein
MSNGIVLNLKKNRVKSDSSITDKLVMVLVYIMFALFALICIFPFYYILINTISSNKLSADGVILFLPREIHLENYVNVFQIPGLIDAAIVSINRTVLGTVLTVAASAFLGFMFTQEDMWGRKFWYRFTIITMYFNAGIIPWYLTMRTLGLTNNFLAYILPWIVSPFFIILVKTFVESTPKELQQAAEIDGAGFLRFFFVIMLPLIQPILATIAIFSAVNQWNSFQDTLLLMTEPQYNSLQFVLYQYINQANSLSIMINNSSSTMAMQSLAKQQTTTSVRMTVTIIVVLPIIMVYPIFQRFFIKGIMIGAVKG